MKYTREVVWNMLQNEAEEKFAAFSLSLLGEGKENTKVIGVRLPRLRRFSKEIAKTILRNSIGFASARCRN